MQALSLVLIGLAAGTMSGLIGIGGATILIPALIVIFHSTQHLAQGTSIAAMLLPVGILAAMKYWQAGNVDIRFALLLALGFLIGGYIGASIAQITPADTLRKIFAIYLVLIALQMFFGK